MKNFQDKEYWKEHIARGKQMLEKKGYSLSSPDIQLLQDQLKRMTEFVNNTPSPQSYMEGTWWGGDFPAFHEIFIPEDWNKTEKSIPLLWNEYKHELDSVYSEYPIPELKNYIKKAKEFEKTVKELLSCW